MKWYFDSEERCQRLRQILEEWKGTPYKHRCAVKGQGADCILFVGAALAEAGAASPSILKNLPDYPRDWHIHRDVELLINEIESRLPVEKLSLRDYQPKNGDILLYRFGKAQSHSSIYMDGKVYQSVMGIGVIDLRFSSSLWANRLKRVYRLRG